MKDFFKILGIMAIMIAIILNVKHAGNDYGIRDNSLWSEVAAQSSSSEGGTGGDYLYCVAEACIGILNPEECLGNFGKYYEECFSVIFKNNIIFFDPDNENPEKHEWCVYQFMATPDCQTFLGQGNKCTLDYHDPAYYSIEIVSSCQHCSLACKDPNSTD